MEKILIKKKDFNKLYQLACQNWKDKFNEMFKYQVFSDELEFEYSFLEEMQKACDDKQLKVFNEIFKKFIKNIPDLFSITTYSKVCKGIDQDEVTEEDFDSNIWDKDFIPKLVAFAKINQLKLLFNKEWKPDWNNTNQYKWAPYFTKNSSGLWSLDGSYPWDSYSYAVVAYYKDQKTSDHIGKYFLDVYKPLLD